MSRILSEYDYGQGLNLTCCISIVSMQMLIPLYILY